MGGLGGIIAGPGGALVGGQIANSLLGSSSKNISSSNGTSETTGTNHAETYGEVYGENKLIKLQKEKLKVILQENLFK